MIKPVLAVTGTPLNGIGGDPGTGLGPWSGLFQSPTVKTAANIFSSVISRIIGLMTIIAGIFFIFQFIIGAFNYLGAGGDQKAIEKAQKYISNAIVGLIIVVAAYAIIYVLGELLGFKILQPQNIIERLGPGS